MGRVLSFHLALLLLQISSAFAGTLPFDTVFKGRAKFDQLVTQGETWKGLPISERTAAVGRALVGTPYKHFTLEIDDRVEAPSVNLTGVDCWTFFEVLSLSRECSICRLNNGHPKRC
jgi:hypothetical protein